LPKLGALIGLILPSRDFHGIPAVELADEDIHPVTRCGADAGAYHIGLNRKLASATIYEHAQKDAPGPSEVGALIQCGANSPAGIEDVVHDHHRLAIEVRQAGLAHHRTRSDGLKVVSVQGDIELAAGKIGAFRGIDEPLQPAGQLHATPLDADEDQGFGTATSLNDLTGHAREGPAECALIQERRAGGHRGGKVVGTAVRRKRRKVPGGGLVRQQGPPRRSLALGRVGHANDRRPTRREGAIESAGLRRKG
jgi:hypothetical protein